MEAPKDIQNAHRQKPGMPKSVQNAHRPRRAQRRTISLSGLNPDEWLVGFEDKLYLYLVDRGIERRESLIIDKASHEVMREKKEPRAEITAPGAV